MAFWGIEVKPEKPYVYRSDERGRLHVSQATLGSGTSTKKTILQCKVGNKKPIYLCSLLPKRLETCALNLEFEEDDEVTFSIVGAQSVHLSGFFYGDNEDNDGDDEYGSDLYEENMMGTDSEDDDVDYDFEDESDDYSSDDLGQYPSSHALNSGVRIEEIVDDEKSADKDDIPKQAKKQKTRSSIADDNEKSNRQIVLKAGSGATLLESEDEDGFPITVNGKKSDTSKPEVRLEEVNDQKVNEETKKTNEREDVACGKKLKGKIDTKGLEGEAARKTSELKSPDQPDTTVAESDHNQKKRKKKRKAGERIDTAQDDGTSNPNGTEESPVAETGNDPKPISEKKKEKKKKKKQKKVQEGVETPNAEGKLTDKSASVSEKEKGEAKSLQVRTFPNGLMIEELAMGKPDGKRASPGKKVGVHYIGKLKKNGKIFDSNIGRAPFRFRLGIGQVIKGWDVGVNGMRIGDKRRLTIPPAMGYGSKGVGQIPANSWLVFDVELVDVN